MTSISRHIKRITQARDAADKQTTEVSEKILSPKSASNLEKMRNTTMSK